MKELQYIPSLNISNGAFHTNDVKTVHRFETSSSNFEFYMLRKNSSIPQYVWQLRDQNSYVHIFQYFFFLKMQ